MKSKCTTTVFIVMMIVLLIHVVHIKIGVVCVDVSMPIDRYIKQKRTAEGGAKKGIDVVRKTKN